MSLDSFGVKELFSTFPKHLVVSVGLEDVGGHLSVVTNLILHLHQLFFLKGQSCCLGE